MRGEVGRWGGSGGEGVGEWGGESKGGEKLSCQMWRMERQRGWRGPEPDSRWRRKRVGAFRPSPPSRVWEWQQSYSENKGRANGSFLLASIWAASRPRSTTAPHEQTHDTKELSLAILMTSGSLSGRHLEGIANHRRKKNTGHIHWYVSVWVKEDKMCRIPELFSHLIRSPLT